MKNAGIWMGLITLVLSGCPNLEDGMSTLLQSREEPPGENCKYGGTRFEHGLDTNSNQVLDPHEISTVTFVCSITIEGKNALTKITLEPAGNHCAAGGHRIDAGVDRDDDGTLDEAEIESTAYVCSGKDGSDGSAGQDGNTALVDISTIDADPNGTCFFGGTRIDVGLDRNRNGQLEPEEVTQTQYVCSVAVNEKRTLINNLAELPGDNCEYGGVKMEVGEDSNDNAILDPDEVTSTNYMCNQVILVEGKTTLMVVQEASEVQCPFGGNLFYSGLDQNYDGILSPTEVENTALVCNGVNGISSLVDATPYSGVNCSDQGGVLYRVGLDYDRDGVLDEGEVVSESTLCNGQDGFLGYDGKNSLIRQSDADSICPHGGIVVESGLDEDENGILAPEEVEYTGYVCHGYNGYNSLIDLADGSSVCPYGGLIIDVGLDSDEDGVLDPAEVEQTSYVCDGYDGLNSLINLADGSSVCPYGGLIIDVGLDSDEDGVLDLAEVEQTSYVCDGYDGLNSLVDIVEASWLDCEYGGIEIRVGLDRNENGVLDSSETESSTIICD